MTSPALNSNPTSNSLDLVSSFYGPGPTSAWYLTALSCAIVWTVHPKEKYSIFNPDFIAVIAFPVIASFHLMFQIRSYPGSLAWPEAFYNNDLDSEHLQLAAGIKASHVAVQAFTVVSQILGMTLQGYTPCRYALEATTLLCFASNAYLYLSTFHTPVFTAGVLNSFLPAIMWILNIALSQWYRANIETMGGAFRVMLIGLNAGWNLSDKDFRSSVDGDGLVDRFFPRTNNSVRELDQAATLFAGGTILSYTLYETVKEVRKLLKERRARSRVNWPSQRPF